MCCAPQPHPLVAPERSNHQSIKDERGSPGGQRLNPGALLDVMATPELDKSKDPTPELEKSEDPTPELDKSKDPTPELEKSKDPTPELEKSKDPGEVVEKTVVKTCKETGETFTFFFGRDCVFSQWHRAEFKVDGQDYNCAEQYMMHQKAVLFDDQEMAAEILRSDDPKEQKAMGRKVRNFDPDIWNEKCKEIVRRGNEAKFSQNPDLKEALLATAGTSMVEASPRDRIWGIGMGAKNPKAVDRSQWRGSNWLGEILTQVRTNLEKKHEQKKHEQSKI